MLCCNSALVAMMVLLAEPAPPGELQKAIASLKAAQAKITTWHSKFRSQQDSQQDVLLSKEWGEIYRQDDGKFASFVSHCYVLPPSLSGDIVSSSQRAFNGKSLFELSGINLLAVKNPKAFGFGGELTISDVSSDVHPSLNDDTRCCVINPFYYESKKLHETLSSSQIDLVYVEGDLLVVEMTDIANWTQSIAYLDRKNEYLPTRFSNRNGSFEISYEKWIETKVGFKLPMRLTKRLLTFRLAKADKYRSLFDNLTGLWPIPILEIDPDSCLVTVIEQEDLRLNEPIPEALFSPEVPAGSSEALGKKEFETRYEVFETDENQRDLQERFNRCDPSAKFELTMPPPLSEPEADYSVIIVAGVIGASVLGVGFYLFRRFRHRVQGAKNTSSVT